MVPSHVSGVLSQRSIHGAVLKMPKATINEQRCLRCEECDAAKICPSKAIFYGCGECVEACANNAIMLGIN